MDDVLERVVRKIERQFTGLDFRQIEHVIDQAEEVLAVGVQAIEHLAHLVRRLAVDVVENKLGVAEDGVERGAQLVAHVGEELRLVLACDLELVALVLDFVKQAHVLNSNHSLIGESGGQLDLLVTKRFYCLATQNDNADRVSFTQERQPQEGVKTSPSCDSSHPKFGVSLNVRNMNRFAL